MDKGAAGRINEVQAYQPQCPKCGGSTTLASVEPSDDPEHDLRTFECAVCDHSEAVKMRFR